MFAAAGPDTQVLAGRERVLLTHLFSPGTTERHAHWAEHGRLRIWDLRRWILTHQPMGHRISSGGYRPFTHPIRGIVFKPSRTSYNTNSFAIPSGSKGNGRSGRRLSPAVKPGAIDPLCWCMGKRQPRAFPL